jgi:hypothetical protein
VPHRQGTARQNCRYERGDLRLTPTRNTDNVDTLDQAENRQFLERIQEAAAAGNLDAVQDMLLERRARMEAQMTRSDARIQRMRRPPRPDDDDGQGGIREPRRPIGPTLGPGATTDE